MANTVELKSIFKGAIKPDTSKFSTQDANNAVINAILENYGLKDATAREIRARQAEIFGLIEETIEELLPEAITDIVGGFAEVRTFARDAEVVFEIKNVGKARLKRGIVAGARGGIYKARRLDNKSFQVPVKVETVGNLVTLEDILLGRHTLGDLFAIIQDGFVERIYLHCIEALRTAKTLAPAANIKSGNGFDGKALDELIRIAGAYGTPIIMGFRSAIAKINNGISWSKTSEDITKIDLDEIRARGIVTVYHGVPVVELPNYLVDESNAEFVFKEGDIFVLPTDAKPIKVAMKGDLHIEENKHPSGSMEQQAHRLVGVGLYLANDICVYTDEEVTGGRY